MNVPNRCGYAYIGELGSNLQASANAASDAEQLALGACQMSERSQASMDQLCESLIDMSTAMCELANAVEAISNVADVIQRFAVVADEVRGLASRSAASTEEIQHTLLGLRKSSQRRTGSRPGRRRDHPADQPHRSTGWRGLTGATSK